MLELQEQPNGRFLVTEWPGRVVVDKAIDLEGFGRIHNPEITPLSPADVARMVDLFEDREEVSKGAEEDPNRILDPLFPFIEDTGPREIAKGVCRDEQPDNAVFDSLFDPIFDYFGGEL